MQNRDTTLSFCRRQRSPFVALRHQVADTGDEFMAVFHGIGERVIAADEQAGGPKILVGDQGLRDRLWGAHQGSGIPPRACGRSQGHP